MSAQIERSLKMERKQLNANVDFYSASTYHTLGLDVDLVHACVPCPASAAGQPT